jgi:hypothetical protein
MRMSPRKPAEGRDRARGCGRAGTERACLNSEDMVNLYERNVVEFLFSIQSGHLSTDIIPHRIISTFDGSFHNTHPNALQGLKWPLFRSVPTFYSEFNYAVGQQNPWSWALAFADNIANEFSATPKPTIRRGRNYDRARRLIYQTAISMIALETGLVDHLNCALSKWVQQCIKKMSV